MKVLITTDWYKPVINGVVTSIVTLEKSLTALGHEVRILTLSNSLHSYQEDSVTYIGSISAGLIYPNARLKVEMASPYVRELIDWQPDVIHSQCEFSTFMLARKISKKCNAPLIHTYHTVYEDFTHYISPNVEFGKRIATALSRYVIKRTQAVIVPTKKIAAMLTGYGVERPIYTVPTGLELTYFTQQQPNARATIRQQLGISSDELIFIYIGRLAKEKNIEELFELIQHRPQRLLLVGDGPYRKTLESIAHKMGIAQQVIFTGMVEPSQVPSYYKAGDIFVSASQSETQGLTYIEAMASALVPLCKKDDCLANVIINGHNGFSYDSPAAFHHAADQLIASAQYRMQLGQAAQNSVLTHFSAQLFAENISSVYRFYCTHSQQAVPVLTPVNSHTSL